MKIALLALLACAPSRVAEPSTCYPDADGDGWGVARADPVRCTSTTATRAADCDDSDPAVHPGAGEVCADGIDNDCDGGPGPCGYAGEIPWTAAFATISTSHVLIGGSDLNADGFDDLLADGTGAAYLLTGPVTGSVSLYDAHTFHADDAGGFGTGLGPGEVSGDGVLDLVIISTTDGGAAWIVAGPMPATAEPGNQDVSDAPHLSGTSTASLTGAVATSDVDGDGIDDVLVGQSTARWGIGSVTFVYGPITADLDLTDADLPGIGPRDREYSGMGRLVVGGTDFDGDGLEDFAYGGDTIDSVAVHVLYGNRVGVDWASSGDPIFAGEPDATSLLSLASPGDLDADGFGDLLLGGVANAGHYGSYDHHWGTMLAGSPDGLSNAASSVLMSASFAGAGDVTGEGLPDLAVGANGYEGPDPWYQDIQRATLYEGPLTAGTHTPDSACAWVLGESVTSDLQVATGGDMNGDGRTDFLVRLDTWSLFSVGPGL